MMWKEINDLTLLYGFSLEDQEKFLNIIRPIVFHKEFKKRYNAKKYPHHGEVSLGKHIIEDALVTFLLVKNNPNNDLNIKVAVLIAMFHDLYEKPWQNASVKKKFFVNKHGFTHPLEAVINAITWYPEYFTNEDAFMIIDGIIHHMYPFPVRAIDNILNIEINNLNKFKKLPLKFQKMIILSSNRLRVDKISITKSIFLEGRILSKADKMVAMQKDLNSFSSLMALLTGKNKTLLKKNLEP